MSMQKTIIIFFLISILNITSAHAYIEPGIISMFLQAIVAAVVGFLAYATLYWDKLKNFTKKLFNKLNKKK